MYRPNAPTSAVLEIIKTFRGITVTGGDEGWLVTFDDRNQFQSSLTLVNMLMGWEATAHPNIKNAIQISES